MRLIDADELIYLTLGEDTETPLEFVPTEFIEKAETVKAIPVEWLQKFFLMRGGDLAFSVMMKEWDYYYGLHERNR